MVVVVDVVVVVVACVVVVAGAVVVVACDVVVVDRDVVVVAGAAVVEGDEVVDVVDVVGGVDDEPHAPRTTAEPTSSAATRPDLTAHPLRPRDSLGRPRCRRAVMTW